jgi:hypothetical protein
MYSVLEFSPVQPRFLCRGHQPEPPDTTGSSRAGLASIDWEPAAGRIALGVHGNELLLQVLDHGNDLLRVGGAKSGEQDPLAPIEIEELGFQGTVVVGQRHFFHSGQPRLEYYPNFLLWKAN